MARWLCAVLVVLVCGLSGCSCEKTDEEILLERIDTTSVHLYLATKIAVLKADQSPEAKAARDQLLLALEAIQGEPVKGSSTSAREMTAEDYVKLAKALWELRAEGKELLESGDEKGMEPFLKVLLADSPDLAALIDLPTEHALLLCGGFGLKFHPRSPVPLPDEILLYEAWMTNTEKLKLEGLAPIVAAVKATVYGTNELCDLAKKEADWAERQKTEQADLASTFSKLAGTEVDLDEQQAAQLNAAVRGIAHGATATCFMQRDEQDKGVEELDKLVEAAHEMGVPSGETAMIRAYVAYQREEYDKAEKALVEARDYEGTPPESKKEIEELIEHVRERDDSKIANTFGKAYFVTAAAGMVVRRLDEAGVFDEIKEGELSKTIDAYVSTAAKAADSLPSMDDAKDQGKKLFDKITE